MKIVKIVKKDSRNVIIYLDNNELIFLNYEVFLKSRLQKNDNVTDDVIDSIIKENQTYAVKQRAFRYLARRHHSESELRIKLKQKKYSKEIIENILSDLKKNNYLNDLEYALFFSEENIKNKLWGKNKVKAELFKKGIDNNIIAKVLEDKFPGGNELENSFVLAEKKYNSLKHRKLDNKKIKEKLFTFLLSKGYDYEIIKETINKVVKDTGDFPEE